MSPFAATTLEPDTRAADAPDRAGADVPVRGTWFSIAPTSLAGTSLAFWILQAYLFLTVTFLDEEWPAVGRLRPRLILGGLALGLALARTLGGRRPTVRLGARSEHRFVARTLVAFALAGTLSAAWAFEPAVSADAQVAHVTTILVFFLLVALVRTRAEVLLTILVFAAGSGFLVLRSATEHMNGKHQFTMGVSRMLGAGSSLSDPNSFAATIAFSLPILVFAAVNARSRLLRLCVAGYGALATWCVIATHSRSGLVLLVLNVLSALVSIPSRRTRLAIAAVLVGLGVGLAALQTRTAMERFASILSADTYANESSTRGRIEGYEIAARMWQDEPLLGVGPGGWSVYRMRKVDGRTLMPHSMPGQLLATTGLVGAATFVAYLLAVVSFALSVRRRRRGATDPWERAVVSLAATTLMTLALLLVSGLAAHNVERAAWYWAPGLLACAARASRESAAAATGGPRDDAIEGARA